MRLRRAAACATVLLSGLVVGAAPANALRSQTTSLPPAYDLVSPYGGVHAFGGAGYYGGATKVGLNARIVGLAPRPDGLGYWLAASDGGIFAYGRARFAGSLGAIHLNAPIVGIAAAPDGDGYWLVASDGGIFSFGSARFHGSTGAIHLKSPIVGMAPTADGDGYWLVASDGGIFAFGDAGFYGSTGAIHLNAPIVAMAAAPGVAGYWLLAADGGVFTFGTAHFLGSAVGAGHASAAVGIAATPDGNGYWIATAKGTVYEFGDAPYRGGATSSALTTIGIAEVTAVYSTAPSPYPAHSLGYDINWPQCNGSSASTVPLPGEPGHAPGAGSYTISVVGVDGWAVDSPNPCLAAEAAWARRATNTGYASYDLYMLLNAPASTSTIDQDGPYGHCASESASVRDSCFAYNYGWNAAVIAHSYATSQGAGSQVWWLDIENTSCSPSNFNGGFGEPWSCDTQLNDLTLDAAVKSLRSLGITVGIYCTAYQWAVIMGAGFVPPKPQIPIWIAGATWTSPPYPQGWAGISYPGEAALQSYCADPGYRFAGGVPWMLQETPGNTNYSYDPDFACGPEAVAGAPAGSPARGSGVEMSVQVRHTPVPG